MRLRLISFLMLLPFCCGAQSTQGSDLLPDKPAHNPQIPTITFQFEFPGANPSHYAISLDTTGRSAYTSTSPQDANTGFAAPGQQPTGEPYVTKFTLSAATAEQIFNLAKRLKNFDGKFDYTKTRVANTGAKTLIYADPARHFETTFNYSQNQDATELARIFQNLSSTLEFGHRIEHDMRYQKLALEDDLRQLQDAVSHNNATEARLLAPILQKIVNDPSIMHIARKRAQDLLATVPQ
jgi:hypothetical protein